MIKENERGRQVSDAIERGSEREEKCNGGKRDEKGENGEVKREKEGER